MFGKLLSKANLAVGGSRKQSQALPPPDISRVIKPAAPAYSATFTEEATESLVADAERAVDNLSEQFEMWMRRDLESLRATWAAAWARSVSPAALAAAPILMPVPAL